MTRGESVDARSSPLAGPDGRDVLFVGLASALFGVLFALPAAEPQVVVETAQVLAGRVDYPADHSFGRYHRASWSLPNQISAGLLRAGSTERTASLLWTALVGATTFAGLGLTVAAAAGSARAVTALPLAAWLTIETGPPLARCYPIHLLGTGNTYGILAVGWAMTTLALLALGARRTGLVLLGLGPAIHPAVGTATLLAGLALLFVDHRSAPVPRRTWGWLAVGLMLSGASFALQSVWKGASAATDEPGDAEAWRWMILHIDYHRLAMPWSDLLPAVLALLATVGTVWWVQRRGPQPPPSARRLLLAVSLLAAGGIVGLLLTRVRELLPAALLMAMPGRYVNLGLQSAAPLAIGTILLRAQGPFAAGAFLAGLGAVAAVFLGAAPSPDWTACWFASGAVLVFVGTTSGRGNESASTSPRIAACLSAAGLALMFAIGDVPWTARIGWTAVVSGGLVLLRSPASARRVRQIAAFATVGGLAAVGAGLVVEWRAAEDLPGLRDARTSAFWRFVQDRPGPLLPMWNERLVQLRAGRPVVVDDSQFNGAGFAYGRPGTMRLVQAVRDLYGYDLLDPAIERRTTDLVDAESDRVARRWIERTPDEWQVLAGRYGFRDVLTPAGVSLRLPLVARGEGYALWEIPSKPDGAKNLFVP